MGTCFINGKPVDINGLTKLTSNFLVVPFNKIPLFSKYVITFTMSFVSLFVAVIHDPLLDVQFLSSSFIPLMA